MAETRKSSERIKPAFSPKSSRTKQNGHGKNRARSKKTGSLEVSRRPRSRRRPLDLVPLSVQQILIARAAVLAFGALQDDVAIPYVDRIGQQSRNFTPR